MYRINGTKSENGRMRQKSQVNLVGNRQPLKVHIQESEIFPENDSRIYSLIERSMTAIEGQLDYSCTLSIKGVVRNKH